MGDAVEQSAGDLLTSFIGRSRQRQQCGAVALEAFRDGLPVSTQPTLLSLQAGGFQMQVQFFPACCAWNRNHEVAPRIAHQAFDLALIVALGWTTELLREQIMTLQLGEGSRLLPFAVAEDPRHRQRGVVIENPRGNTAKIGEGSYVTFEKSFGGFGRKCHHEAIVGMGQVEGKIVGLALHSGNYNQSFTEVGLRFTWCVTQRHEHLPGAELRLAYVVLHDRVAACVTVLLSQSLEDPLRGVPLPSWPALVFFQNGVDGTLPWTQLRP